MKQAHSAQTLLPEPLERRMLLASTVIPIAARDVVFDPQRDVLYMTPPSGGQIQRWDVATQQLLTPINSGAGYVWGMDITPDGSALIVADGAVQGEFGAIRKVSLDTGVIDTFLYTRDGNEASAWDVAVVSNTRAFVTTRHFFDSAEYNPLRELDLVTGTFTPRTLPGGLAGGKLLRQGNLGRSGDRSTMVITEQWNTGGGKAWVYDTATETFSDPRQVGAHSLPNVSADGSLIALGPYILSRESFNTAPYTNNASAGLAFDPNRPLVFQGNVQQAAIRVLNHVTGLDQGFIPGDQQLGGIVPMGSGLTAISDDSQYLYMTVGNAVRQYRISEPPVVSVNDMSVYEGGVIGLYWNGSYGVSTWGRTYEWDVDYDGLAFEPDYVNQPASFSAAGLGGPAQRQIAVRLTNVVGESAMATGTVNVLNVAPAIELGGDIRIGAGGRLKWSRAFTDPGADTWSGSVDYGDGSGLQPLVIDPATKTFALDHTFATTGAYSVTVQLSDGDDTASDTFMVEAPGAEADGITPAPGATYVVSGAGPGRTVTITGGAVTLAGGVWDGSLRVGTGATALLTGSAEFGDVAIDDSAALNLAPGAGTSTIKALNIAPGGQLDVADNGLIVDYASVSPVGIWSGNAYDGIAGYVQSGRIKSSAASGNLKKLGVAEAREVLGITGTQTGTFAGQAVDSTAVLVKFTWGGDANFDGKLNIDDYGRIDSNVAQSGSVWGWFNGDFNYDGAINIDDYGIIDGNMSQQDSIL